MVEPETDARCQGVGVFIGAAPPVEIADVTGHEQTFERLDVRNQLAHAGIVVFTGIETCRDCPRICECFSVEPDVLAGDTCFGAIFEITQMCQDECSMVSRFLQTAVRSLHSGR